VLCLLEVEAAGWGLVARWGCGAGAAAAAGGVTSFISTSCGIIKSVRFVPLNNKNKPIIEIVATIKQKKPKETTYSCPEEVRNEMPVGHFSRRKAA